MIVVDTNVISELMRGEPHPAVLSWVAAQPRSLLYTTYVSQAEILYGIAALPEGRRRMALATAARMASQFPAGVSNSGCRRRWGLLTRRDYTPSAADITRPARRRVDDSLSMF